MDNAQKLMQLELAILDTEKSDKILLRQLEENEERRQSLRQQIAGLALGGNDG